MVESGPVGDISKIAELANPFAYLGIAAGQRLALELLEAHEKEQQNV